MRKSLTLATVVCLLLLAASSVASSQEQSKPAAKAAPAPTVSSVLDRRIAEVEQEFVSLAEAMPEDKYSFAPTNGEFKGVRNFGDMVKHVASVNHGLASTMLGEKPALGPDAIDKGPDSVKTKAEIVQYLKDSFANLHKAAAGVDEKNLVTPIDSPFGPGKTTRLGAATIAIGHSFDHYGQLVEYLRMNGIIPPASRPPAK